MENKTAPVKSELPKVKSRLDHDTKRAAELTNAIQAYIAACKQIPPEWLKELGDISRASFNK